MNHSLTLLGRVPSKKNSKRRVQRGHHVFMIPSEAHELWHREQLLACRSDWTHGQVFPERMELIFFPPDHRKADLSNKTESVMDLLVDAGIIADDSWFIIPVLHLLLGGVDKKEPRVVVNFY